MSFFIVISISIKKKPIYSKLLFLISYITGATDELEDVKLCNNSAESNVDNMIQLTHLHEPAILHCLEKRYEISDIYTYTGTILIAVNPFKALPIYDTRHLEMYYKFGLMKSEGCEMASALAPHVFAIADAAYRNMMLRLSMPPTVSSDSQIDDMRYVVSANQSILISGESGAG